MWACFLTADLQLHFIVDVFGGKELVTDKPGRLQAVTGQSYQKRLFRVSDSKES